MFQKDQHHGGSSPITAKLSLADVVAITDAKTKGQNDQKSSDTAENEFNSGRPKLTSVFSNGYGERLSHWARNTDWTPDLGQDIGSLRWFRGLGSLILLCTGAWFVLPGAAPIGAHAQNNMSGAIADELRSQMITPIAFGSDTGRLMAPGETVLALAESPERPEITIGASLGQGDSLPRLMQRAGVGRSDSQQLINMISGVLPLNQIESGTRFDMVLGRRTSQNQPRPLESLKFRARFDLNIDIARQNGQLIMNKEHIMVDNTPLRIRGVVGSSLYRSARAAGVPAGLVQEYLKVLGAQMPIGNIRSSDEFDFIIDYKRSAAGEVKMGGLLYAGLERSGKAKAQLLKWSGSSGTQWYEASGVGEVKGELMRPVSSAISSSYGMRRHPILGYRRMHSGVDFRAGYGTPIRAATSGVVKYAGRKGGYGKFVKIAHGRGLATGYAHMSRISVSSGARVKRGQIIGYVGSTGLSTGPHLHYEMYRNGRTINPLSVNYTTRAQLTGSELKNFRARLGNLLGVEPGAALQSLTAPERQEVKPAREIERLSNDMQIIG